MKKLLLVLIAIMSFTLFGCTKTVETKEALVTIKSIELSTEHSGVEFEFELSQDEQTMNTEDIKNFGVLYRINELATKELMVIGDHVTVIESSTISIAINDIGNQFFNQTFYARAFYVYEVDGQEDVIVYSDKIDSFTMYDMALNSDTNFATDIRFIVEHEVINDVTIDIDLDDDTLTSNSSTYDVSIERSIDDLNITVIPKNGYRFAVDLSLFVNGQALSSTAFTKEEQTLTFTFSNPIIIVPILYSDVDVTFDPDGGVWESIIFNTFTPEVSFSITALNDTYGNTLTLVDHSVTSMRWFYKLFIKYDEVIDAYQVVYTDHATSTIENLTLPDYDYVIAVHDNCLDESALINFLNYTEGLEEEIYVTFESNISTYTSGTIVASLYHYNTVSNLLDIRMNEQEALPIPYKSEFTFNGWSDGARILSVFPRYEVSENITEITYTALWESNSIDEATLYLSGLIPNDLTGNLILPIKYSGYTISWNSDNSNVLTNEGVYQRPYQATTIGLTATLQNGNQVVTKTYDINVEGYKSLNDTIASSYIYRDYPLVTDEFFETLDIINCAFIKASSDGTLSGTSVLRNINTYIMPKAKEHGNWVLFSVAPSSDWSVIASNTNTINTFADNIVNMINEHGFDGVDIDWETPTTQESASFTAMMQVIYTKVKANNPNHLVTAAVAGGMWQPPRYDLTNSHQYMDYINMMTYGMVSNNGYYQNALSKSTAFDNPANSAGKTLVSCSIEESVAIYNTYGIPNDKIIVGVAFYGMKQTRTFNASNQTWSNWESAGSVSFTLIVNNYINNENYTVYYDSNAGVPYILSNDGTEFISYDNAQSIAEKSEFIITEGLAGMMYWEDGLDHTGTLLAAMELGLKQAN